MTTYLDNMTQAEFDELMAEIKEKRPNLFQFIADFVDRKVSTEEVDDFLKMERSEQVDTSRTIKRGHNMNELDLTNTQALILLLVIGVIFLCLKLIDKRMEVNPKNLSEKSSNDLDPYYGRYIQLGMVSKGG